MTESALILTFPVIQRKHLFFTNQFSEPNSMEVASSDSVTYPLTITNHLLLEK